VNRRTGLIVVAAATLAALLLYLASPALRAEVNAGVALAARADIAPLRDYLLGFGVWAVVASATLQLLTSIIAPLPSFVLAFVNAMLFGFAWGSLLTWTTALGAAGVCFGMSRVMGRPVVERFVSGRALDAADHFFHTHGVAAVLVARLIPFINPDVISYAAGLTAMRWRPFVLAVGIGSVPSTLLYSYLGSRGVTSVGWLLVPLVALGIGALLVAAWQGRRDGSRLGR